MKLSIRAWCCSVLWLLSAPAVWACAICAPADVQHTLVQRLFAADAVVLAVASDAGNGWRVLDTLKGVPPSAPILVAAPSPGSAPAGTQLLAYSAATQSWRVLGHLEPTRTGWARRLMAMRRAVDTPEAAWPQRLAFFAPDLEHAEPLVAQAAYEEISVAPYAAMRTLRPVLDAASLARWLDAPELASRRPLYTLLLGVAGAAAAAERLEARLLGADAALAQGEHSALFAAYLELRGSAGLQWVERQFLTDPSRPEQALQAALLALSVHGNDGVRLSRERVIQAYAALIRHNPARAGLVASDLGNWERWEFATDFAAILKSGTLQAFASRYGMVFYLMRNPTPAAREALQALRAANLL